MNDLKSGDLSGPSTPVPQITLSLLALFWLPLALMWVLMGVEQPVLNGVMARLPDATRSLAAFEVAFGIALVIESPILQILSAATALVRGPRSYRQMLRFMHLLAAVLTLVHFIVSRPVVFEFVTRRILGVPEDVIEPARRRLPFLCRLPRWSDTAGCGRVV